MAIINIPNQPIQFNIPIYESCEDERLNCALYKENDGLIYTQFQITPCFEDIAIPDIVAESSWTLISSGIYEHTPIAGGNLLSFIADWGASGNYIRFRFKFTGITDGNCLVDFVGTNIANVTENGTYEIYSAYIPFAPPTDALTFFGSATFNGTLEFLGADAFYIPTDALDWISVYNFKDEPYTISESCLNVTTNQDRINLSIDPSCFEPNCYYLKVCDPCLASSIAPEFSLDGAVGWSDSNNCFYPGCDFPASINYSTSIEVDTFGSIGNLIEILFTSPTTSLNYSNCCYEIKFYFGKVDTMDVSIQMSRDNCQETFIPQAYSTKSIICCSYFDKIEFNLLIEETVGISQRIEIQKVEIIPTIACLAGVGQCKTTNCFQIIPFNASTDTKLIVGDSQNGTYQLGFYWDNNFQLKQRLQCVKHAPFYPTDGKSYIFSDGSMKITSAQRSKFYEIVFGQLEEYQHDVLSAQILCKQLTIDGIEYVVDPQDYKPEWFGKIGYSRADVKLIGMEQSTIIFKSNEN